MLWQIVTFFMKDGEDYVKDFIGAWYSACPHPGFLKLFQIFYVCMCLWEIQLCGENV